MKARRLLSVAAAVEYLDFPSVAAFHSFLYRRRKAGFPVRCFHRGRAVRFLESDLDAVLEVEERKSLRRVG